MNKINLKRTLLFSSLIIFILFIISNVKGDTPYSNCEVYGNCAPISSSSSINNNSINVNNSALLQGLTAQQVANLYQENTTWHYNQSGSFQYNQTFSNTNVAYLNNTQTFTSNQLITANLNISQNITVDELMVNTNISLNRTDQVSVIGNVTIGKGTLTLKQFNMFSDSAIDGDRNKFNESLKIITAFPSNPNFSQNLQSWNLERRSAVGNGYSLVLATKTNPGSGSQGQGIFSWQLWGENSAGAMTKVTDVMTWGVGTTTAADDSNVTIPSGVTQLIARATPYVVPSGFGTEPARIAFSMARAGSGVKRAGVLSFAIGTFNNNSVNAYTKVDAYMNDHGPIDGTSVDSYLMSYFSNGRITIGSNQTRNDTLYIQNTLTGTDNGAPNTTINTFGIQAINSQTGNLMEIRNSTGKTTFKVSSTGEVNITQNVTVYGDLLVDKNITASYIAANGTVGFTGTCTILGLTNIQVVNGLIVGCA